MQEEILPGRETQDWMWETIEKKAADRDKKQGHKLWFRIATGMAAVLVLIVILPQTSLAEQIQGFMKEFFYAYADVEGSIAQNVYEDEGKYGHVRMSIQEMLSDGSYVYCNICYEALDTLGEKWLEEQEFDIESIRVSWGLDDEDDEWFEGGGQEMREQKELATEKTRYFAFLFYEVSGKFSLRDRSITLFYPMYKSQGIGKVEIVSNLAAVSYRLVGDKSPSKYYEPKYLIVSKLSYGIFGINRGADESFIDKDNVWHFQYGKGFAEEKGDGDIQGFVYSDGLPLSFTMENGLKVDVGYAPPCFSNRAGVPGADLLISSGYFEVGEEDWGKNKTIGNPSALTGVDIDGVHYDLVKED